MSKNLKPIAKLIVAFYAGIILLMTFQNCGQVHVESAPSIPPPNQVFNEETVSYLKIDNSLQDIFRAVFVIDVSNSMYSGACPDSIDVTIPDVEPSPNCLGPTGVDPQGNRYEIMLKWLDELQDKITNNVLTDSQVKILVLPFSGPYNVFFNSRWTIATINRIATPLGLTISPGFVSVDMARNFIYFIWAIEAKWHAAAFSSTIPLTIRNAVKVSNVVPDGNFSASTGTSMVAPSLETMNQDLNTELLAIKNSGANELAKAHFELAFFSDGVPKPHSLHVEAAVKFVWARKKEVCDTTLLPANQNCGDSFSGSEYGWANVDATSCITRCGDYLKTYADTGEISVPGSERPVCSSYYSIPYECSGYSDGANFFERWSSKIKCGQCFELLKQFDFSKSSRPGDYPWNQRDGFKDKINQMWGDWTENRHSNIIGKLKTTVNIFKIQYPGPNWKMSFNRIDSSVPAYQTQPGEMIKDLNWMVHAEDYFAKKHRFFTIKDASKPFELFQELQNGQSYKLGMIYVYNRNLRSSSSGAFLVDTDGDGVADVDESSGQQNTARSDGVCLDSIKKIYGQCLTTGCDPTIDRDGDGLNQCEEATIGTDDFDPDTDDDGILDGSELLFELNPNQSDQTLYSNTDGFSNFEHFIKGFSSFVNLNNVPADKIINISADLVDYKTVKDSRGLDMQVPGYNIKVKNLPITEGQPNQIVVVVRVDNYANPNDKRWLSKTYTLTSVTDALDIKLEELAPLNLGAP